MVKKERITFSIQLSQQIAQKPERGISDMWIAP